MKYVINKDTGGLCDLNEFMKRYTSCEKCPKKKLCDRAVEEYERKNKKKRKK